LSGPTSTGREEEGKEGDGRGEKGKGMEGRGRDCPLSEILNTPLSSTVQKTIFAVKSFKTPILPPLGLLPIICVVVADPQDDFSVYFVCNNIP